MDTKPNARQLFLWIFAFLTINAAVSKRSTSRESVSNLKSDIDVKQYQTVARLPDTTEPISYVIDITANIDGSVTEFLGKVELKISILKNTSAIVLHSDSLVISDAFLVKIGQENDSNTQEVAAYTYDDDKNFVTFRINRSVVFCNGDIWLLKIMYQGYMRQNDEGFFRKMFENSKREKMYIGATQLAPIGARMVLPCYDELIYKATIQLSLTHSKKYSALSNMPVTGPIIDNTDGTCTTSFQKTPKMPVYLFAFAIGDFRESHTNFSSTQISVISIPELHDKHSYAMQTIPRLLGALEKYLDSRISSPKIDNLALPQFKRAAMENSGLIIYKENNLLTLKEKSVDREMKIASTIARELVHYWFSNLLTPAWWSYTWISKGLAILLASNVLQMVNPNCDMDQIFVTDTLQEALATTFSNSYQPLTLSPKDNFEIKAIFDTVTYSKGATIFRMLQHILTEGTFKKGLSKCIVTLKYGTITPDLLIQCFNEAAMDDARFESTDINLSSFLESWTLQSGYPLVTVIRDYESGTFRLRQEPFDEIGNVNRTRTNRVWWIPFNYVTKNLLSFTSTSIDGYLDGSGDQIISPALKMWTNNDWLIVNKQQTNFYRVNYDPINWGLITEALWKDHETIHVINRAQIIDDAYHLVIAHRLQARVLLNILKYIIKEKEYAPWKTFEKIWSRLRYHLSERHENTILKSFVRDISSVPYERFQILNNPNENYMKRLTRNIIVNLACQSGYQQCLRDAKTDLQNILVNGSEHVEHDNKVSILCNGMISATHLDFSMVLSLVMRSRDKTERKEYMSALGCMQDSDLIRLYLRTATKRTFDINYSHEERLYVIKSVVQRDSTALRLAIEFLLGDSFKYSIIKTGGEHALLEAVREIANHVDKNLELIFRRLLKKLQRYSLISKQSIKLLEDAMRRNNDGADRHRQPFAEWLHTFEKKSKIVAAFAKSGRERLSWMVLIPLVYLTRVVSSLRYSCCVECVLFSLEH